MAVTLVYSLILLANAGLNLANQDCPFCDTITVDLNTDLDGEVEVRWTLNDSSNIVYGFKTVLHNGDDEKIYESPILHVSQRAMTIKVELEDQTKICVQVFGNETEIIVEKCDVAQVTDLSAIVGILAGTIFIIPCIIALLIIIWKDRKIIKEQAYERLKQDHAVDLLRTKNLRAKAGIGGVENKAFNAEPTTKHIQTRLGTDVEEIVIEVPPSPHKQLQQHTEVKITDEVSSGINGDVPVQSEIKVTDGANKSNTNDTDSMKVNNSNTVLDQSKVCEPETASTDKQNVESEDITGAIAKVEESHEIQSVSTDAGTSSESTVDAQNEKDMANGADTHVLNERF